MKQYIGGFKKMDTAWRMALCGILGLVALSQTQLSFAACPAVNSYLDADVKNVNDWRNRRGRTIYFCKQDFPQNTLSLDVQDADLVSGGSQSITQGATVQTGDLSVGSIDFTGFTPSALSLNQISGDFPNVNGQFGSPSLYNFYSHIGISSDCRKYRGKDQYERILTYLRQNANIFQASSSGVQTGVADASGNNIARINDAVLVHQTTGDTITADIVFYHANAGMAGQYFTRFSRYCWVGVGARIEMDGQTAGIDNAGDYVVNVGVLTEE